MNWLLILLLVVALFMIAQRVRSGRARQCQNLACEVETRRPVPVMMPYSWDTPQVVANYKYF